MSTFNFPGVFIASSNLLYDPLMNRRGSNVPRMYLVPDKQQPCEQTKDSERESIETFVVIIPSRNIEFAGL